METATVEPQKEAEISNIIFEWVDFLYQNKSNIESYDKVIGKYRRLWSEAHSLKPKHPLSDDTAYQKKLKEAREQTEILKSLQKKYFKKYTELGFEKYAELGLDRPTIIQPYSFREILDEWVKKTTDKTKAREQLTDCKNKYNQLQTDNVQTFLSLTFFFFFEYMGRALNEIFDKVLGNKYQALADELEPYLEQYDANVIESIIDSKQLPYGAEKPIWRKQADAHVFKNYMKWGLKDINKLFRFRNRKGEIIDETAHNTKSKEPNSDLLAILTKYIIK